MAIGSDNLPVVVGPPLPEEKEKRRSSTSLAGRVTPWLKRAFTLAILLGGWQLLVSTGTVDEVIVPSPRQVWDASWEVIPTSLFYGHLKSTLTNMGAGYLIGVGIGLGLALLLVRWDGLRAYIYDYIIAFEAVPKVTLVPVLVTWFGFGSASKVVLAAMITFWPVFLTAYTGMTNVDANAVKLMTSVGASPFQTLRMMRFPFALPTISAGLRNGLTNALIGAILAELFGSPKGIGYLITTYNFSLRIANVFAVILAISVVAVLLLLLLDFILKRVIFWAD